MAARTLENHGDWLDWKSRVNEYGLIKDEKFIWYPLDKDFPCTVLWHPDPFSYEVVAGRLEDRIAKDESNAPFKINYVKARVSIPNTGVSIKILDINGIKIQIDSRNQNGSQQNWLIHTDIKGLTILKQCFEDAISNIKGEK